MISSSVDMLTNWAGERIDFIVNANQEVDNYWIRFHGLGLCEPPRSNGVYQVAVLRYTGALPQDPESAVGFNIPITPPNTRVKTAL